VCPSSKTRESPTQSSRRSPGKRNAILAAAIVEFSKNGFAGTNMDKVALMADVSKRTIYNHFLSKDELFDAILNEVYERYRISPGISYDPKRPLRPQLIELLSQIMDRFSDANLMSISRVAMIEMIRSPARGRIINERIAKEEQGLASWLRAACKDGRLLISDLQFAKEQLEGLIRSFVFWPQSVFGAPPLTKAQQIQVLNNSADMFLKFYQVSRRRAYSDCP
jgi:TetR/AcrR family transcriptional regulator, regulator of autoinduction and epiphytic fitness